MRKLVFPLCVAILWTTVPLPAEIGELEYAELDLRRVRTKLVPSPYLHTHAVTAPPAGCGTVHPKREVLSRLGATVGQLQDVVATALGGVVAGQIYEGDRRFDIVVRLPEHVRSDPDHILSYPVERVKELTRMCSLPGHLPTSLCEACLP